MYDPALTTWTLESVGCDKVKYTAVIPTASLISNVGATNCNKVSRLRTTHTHTHAHAPHTRIHHTHNTVCKPH